MDSNYINILDKLTFLKAELEQLFDKAQSAERTFENKEAFYVSSEIIEAIDTAKYNLKRLSSKAIEGKLEEQANGKFEMIRNDNYKGLGYDFSCGNYLECWDEENKDWKAGRVEGKMRNGENAYYFHNAEMQHPFLHQGMKVRIREFRD